MKCDQPYVSGEAPPERIAREVRPTTPRRRKRRPSEITGVQGMVTHNGVRLLAQTEHLPGEQTDQIVTQLFAQGLVVATHKSTHAPIPTTSIQNMQLLARRQHLIVLRGLARGKYDAKIQGANQPVGQPSAHDDVPAEGESSGATGKGANR